VPHKSGSVYVYHHDDDDDAAGADAAVDYDVPTTRYESSQSPAGATDTHRCKQTFINIMFSRRIASMQPVAIVVL